MLPLRISCIAPAGRVARSPRQLNSVLSLFSTRLLFLFSWLQPRFCFTSVNQPIPRSSQVVFLTYRFEARTWIYHERRHTVLKGCMRNAYAVYARGFISLLHPKKERCSTGSLYLQKAWHLPLGVPATKAPSTMDQSVHAEMTRSTSTGASNIHQGLGRCNNANHRPTKFPTRFYLVDIVQLLIDTIQHQIVYRIWPKSWIGFSLKFKRFSRDHFNAQPPSDCTEQKHQPGRQALSKAVASQVACRIGRLEPPVNSSENQLRDILCISGYNIWTAQGGGGSFQPSWTYRKKIWNSIGAKVNGLHIQLFCFELTNWLTD